MTGHLSFNWWDTIVRLRGAAVKGLPSVGYAVPDEDRDRL
jgi:hypothetical protein